jgi:hypothetical protein
MSDMTLGAALRNQARLKKVREEARAKTEAYWRWRKHDEERREKARKDQEEAMRAFWCSLGQHHTSKHFHLNEEFAGATICMGCQLKIVANLETVTELPAVTKAIAEAGKMRKVEAKQRAIMFAMNRKEPHNGDGFVYYMRINGRIKIGYTTNLKQRSRNYPPGTELIAVEPGTRETEARRHDQFSRSLAQGREWFAESPALTEHMAALARKYGVPTELMYQHARHEGIKHV